MRLTLQTQAFERVTPILQPGEQPITASRTMVGRFSSGRLTAVLTNSNPFGVTGALGTTLLASKKQYVVVTDRRLIFLSQTVFGGPGKKVIAEVPRGYAALAEANIGFLSLVRIAFGTEGDGVALTFPRVDQKNAKALVAALESVATR